MSNNSLNHGKTHILIVVLTEQKHQLVSLLNIRKPNTDSSIPATLYNRSSLLFSSLTVHGCSFMIYQIMFAVHLDLSQGSPLTRELGDAGFENGTLPQCMSCHARHTVN
ncbi:hypothetical protein FPOAC2_12310 [Fusarium poae]|jgi:hypothetical protein